MHTMHSWASSSLRKTEAQIGLLAAKSLGCRRSLSTESNSSLVGSSRRFERKESSFLRYGVVVAAAASSLGLYCCSSFNSGGSFLSYADSGARPEKKKPAFLFTDTYRRKVFFKYEKRIRTRSPPEKVFEYFASFKSPSGEVYMTASDLMRAVVPVFPPSEANIVRGGYLKGELISSELHCPPSEFFMLFDTNNDGLISFPEYIFFVTILSIPESSFSVAFKMFDLDNNGRIDKIEFRKVMTLMRSRNRQGASHRDGMRIGMKVSGSVEEGGLVEYFFGKEGTRRLEHDRFVEFLRDLQNEVQLPREFHQVHAWCNFPAMPFNSYPISIWTDDDERAFYQQMLRLEFAHYDFKSQGTISAKDFVFSMVASADMRYIDKFLDQADELDTDPSLSHLRITFEEFENFAMLRKRLEQFSIALFSYGRVNGLLSKQDFKRAARQVCGISLSDKVVDLVFYVFDLDRNGSLSSEEFLRVLERREMDISQPQEAGLAGLISCWLDCTRNCSSKKLF